MLRILILLGFVALSFLNSFSQRLQRSAISSAGNSYSVNGIVVRQSVGQAANTAVFTNKNTLRQGFQQPLLFHFFAEPNQNSNLLSIIVYPNPVSGFTSLAVSDSIQGCTVVIRSYIGQTLYTCTVLQNPMSIDCRSLPDGVYLLSLIKDNQIHSTVKIVKRNKP